MLASAVSTGWGGLGERARDPWKAASRAVVPFFEWFGELGIFCWRLTRALLSRPFEGREWIRQLDDIGSKSAPLVVLAGAALGVVMSLQTRSSLIRFGAKSLLPA